MSRHRNVRNYAYEEDMYDDVYGHSVEEHDLCVSPTTAQQFLYRRSETEHPNLSSFMEEPSGYDDEEYEDNKSYLRAEKDYKTPKLDRESEAKLLSCLDQFRSILGDNCDENEATAAILKHDFDLERAIDDVLSQGGNQDLKSHNVSKQEKDVLQSDNISDFCPEQNFQNCQPDEASKCSSSNKPLPNLNAMKLSSPLASLQHGSTTLPKNVHVSPLKEQLNCEKRQDKTSPLAQLLDGKKYEGKINNTSLNKSEDLRVTPLMDTLNIQDSPKSPLSLLLGKQGSGNAKQAPTKTLASGGLHLPSLVNIAKGETSPLSKLKDSKQSLAGNTWDDAVFGKRNTSEEGSQKSSIVHIPKNDGYSSLSQLLKTRQSPRDNRTKNDQNNSSVAQPNSSSGRMVFNDSEKYVSLNVPEISANTPPESRCDIDLSAQLQPAKTEEKSKPRHADSVSAYVNIRTIPYDIKESDQKQRIGGVPPNDVEDGFQKYPVGRTSPNNVESCVHMQTIEFHKDLAFHDSARLLLHVPSTFACTLHVYYKKPGRQWKPTTTRMFKNDLGIVPFDFNEPSPDDIVLSKQKKRSSTKK